MRVITFYSWNGSTISWEADRDSRIVAANQTFSPWILTLDPQLTYAAVIARMNSTAAAVDEFMLWLDNGHNFPAMNFEVLQNQKIFAVNGGGGSSFLQILVEDLSPVVA